MNAYTGPAALVLMAGAPGSGKSWWVAERFRPTQVVCLDVLRGQLTDDEGDQSATREAAAIMHRIVAYRMGRRLTTVVDATHAKYDDRHRLWSLAQHARVPTVAVVLDTPVDVCVARQAYRARQVPERVVRRIHAAITRDLCGGVLLLPAEITRTVTPAGDHVRGHVPDDMAGAPWLA